MRRISQRMSPPLLGVPAYLRSLAAAAGVGLGPVLHWAGIDLARPSDRSFGVAWGRLALVFRLPIREALLHLRLTFADEVGQDLTPGLMMALRSGSGAVSLLDQFEASLSAAVQTWDTEMQARLQASEGELLAAYRRAATDEAG
jgi:hypothetical protein